MSDSVRPFKTRILWRLDVSSALGRRNGVVIMAKLSSSTTTEISKLLTSCLTTIKIHVMKYCEKVFERPGKIFF